MTSLVRTGQADELDSDALRARVAELEALLTERAADIARVGQDLAAFKIQYRQRVGRLHEELDELEREIAEAELGEKEQLVMCAREMEALKDTPMWKLKAMVDEATVSGKDLVREMVVRLRRDIMVARHRLEALRPVP